MMNLRHLLCFFSNLFTAFQVIVYGRMITILKGVGISKKGRNKYQAWESFFLFYYSKPMSHFIFVIPHCRWVNFKKGCGINGQRGTNVEHALQNNSIQNIFLSVFAHHSLCMNKQQCFKVQIKTVPWCDTTSFKCFSSVFHDQPSSLFN